MSKQETKYKKTPQVQERKRFRPIKPDGAGLKGKNTIGWASYMKAMPAYHPYRDIQG